MARTREEWTNHLSTLKGARVEYPFGPEARVLKVGSKMFALLTEEEEPARITLKADPERSEEWREVYADVVKPGYHMNKRHWNTVRLDGTVPDEEMVEMIQHSYDLVLASLPKATRSAIQESAKTEG